MIKCALSFAFPSPLTLETAYILHVLFASAVVAVSTMIVEGKRTRGAAEQGCELNATARLPCPRKVVLKLLGIYFYFCLRFLFFFLGGGC